MPQEYVDHPHLWAGCVAGDPARYTLIRPARAWVAAEESRDAAVGTAQRRAAARAASSERSPTLLIVEADRELRELLGIALGDAGLRVVATASHDEALGYLRAFRFALILADSGRYEPDDAQRWHTLERLRAATGETPVVICTAHPSAAFDGWAARGFAGVLPKPFELNELLGLVRAAIAPVGQPLGEG